MDIFKKLTTQGLESSEDRLGGGGFSPLESGLYTGKVKLAYAGQSSTGASNITLVLDLDGREYTETVYVTNRKGENFYTRDNKKFPLPGFTVIDDLCLVTTGKPLAEQDVEEKVVNVYDYEAKKELPKAVPMLVELLGNEVTLGIIHQVVNKNEKNNNGEYVPVAATRDENFTDKVFHTETRMTVVEAQNGLEAAKFIDAWEAKNKGKTRDKRTIKDDDIGSSNKPPRPSTAAATAPAAPKKSLFGNKG